MVNIRLWPGTDLHRQRSAERRWTTAMEGTPDIKSGVLHCREETAIDPKRSQRWNSVGRDFGITCEGIANRETRANKRRQYLPRKCPQPKSTSSE